MNLNNILEKLRNYNKADYRQIRFCIGFAVMLISSYLMMLFSPIVQNTLPAGGDSRKQIYLIFGLAVMGCIMFCAYATGLFLRYKSKEMGVFLSLGTDKRKITKALLIEIAGLSIRSSALGIAAGCVLALIIGNVIKLLAGDSTDYGFAFTGYGIAASLLFGIIIILFVMIQAKRFIKRSNIMEILNEQRRQEPLRKMVTKKYLLLSLVLFISGVFTAFILPGLVVKATRHYMGGWTNLFYILAVIGMYRMMVYSISCHKKGKNPQKYYNHMISYGMLKFTGASIVRNMLVITLLIMGGLFALFYVPMNSLPGKARLETFEDKYSYFYPDNANEISKEEVEEMALEFGVTIDNYREAKFVAVIGSGIQSENLDENGNLEYLYINKFAMHECIGASEYKRITGIDIQVEDGNYYMIQSPDAKESVFNRFDDMDRLYLQDDEAFLTMNYMGNTEYQSLVTGKGYGPKARFVISDTDYQALLKNAEPSRIITHVLFGTEESREAIQFSKELYKEYTLRQSENMQVCSEYDTWQAQKKGKDYGYNIPAVYDPDNSIKETDWMFMPSMILLEKDNYFLSNAVKFLLFLYVAMICLAAVGIISYTRSQSVGTANRQIFKDIEKLGANHGYLKKLLKGQIKKVFILPSIIGCIGITFFEILLMLGNDGRVTVDEYWQMLFIAVFILIVVTYQFVIYRASEKKAAVILGL